MSRRWLQFTKGSVPVVDVRLGNRRYRALIDTGSAYTMIMPDLALKLGLPRVGTKMIVALNGQYETLVTVDLPPVGFGNTELVAHEAGLRNLRPLGLGVELLLGVAAFQKLRLQIDFKEGHIYLLD
jgi:predicted aspartyl protease